MLTLGTVLAAVSWRRCRAVATVILIATFSRPLLEFTLKAIVDRDRPDLERLVNGTGPSFPSGHVMAAAALWGLAPLVVTLYTRNRRIWWAATIASAPLILAIGASRTYLGVHWLSDVVAGFIVGAFFLRGAEWLLAQQHRRRPCAATIAGSRLTTRRRFELHAARRWCGTISNARTSAPGLRCRRPRLSPAPPARDTQHAGVRDWRDSYPQSCPPLCKYRDEG